APAEQDRDLHCTLDGAEQVAGGLRERVGTLTRQVPAGVVARHEHVGLDGNHPRCEHAQSRQPAGRVQQASAGLGESGPGGLHPHLQESTTRVVTNRPQATSERSNTTRRKSTMPFDISSSWVERDTWADSSRKGPGSN